MPALFGICFVLSFSFAFAVMTSSSETSCTTGPAQLIDENLTFQSKDVSFGNTSSEVGTDYNVVAVLGSQASGSSTLLNDIFGTQFSTGSSHFEKTTKGVQSSWHSDLNALILDTQGYSGGHRTGAEQKITQFVTATSDIVLLNLKQDEVARHALQYKQVMETACRTALDRYEEEDPNRKIIMLLYVIRDWDGSMDIDSAISKLTKGLLAIWMSAVEGSGRLGASFSDYFRLGMITLPHKSYDSEGYNEQVALLRERFKIDAEDSFAPMVARSDVPLRDAVEHMSGLWKTIRGCVNVSSERRAFAERLCPLFVNSALEVSKRAIKAKVDVNSTADEFRKASIECQEAGLTQYDRVAKCYDQGVVQSHRLQLSGAIDAELSECYVAHVGGLRSVAITEFTQRLASLQRTIFPMPPIPSKILFPKIDELKADCLKVFKDLSDAAKVNPEWKYQKEEDLFVSGMDALIEPVREKQAAIDLSLERSVAIFAPMSANPLADMSKLLADSAGIGRMMVAALFRS